MLRLPKDGLAVRRLRKRLGVPQCGLAALLGVSRRTVIRLEQADSLSRVMQRALRDIARDRLKTL